MFFSIIAMWSRHPNYKPDVRLYSESTVQILRGKLMVRKFQNFQFLFDLTTLRDGFQTYI